MTKRAAGKFERNEDDFYPTPPAPILKLMPYLDNVETFGEPFCGDGSVALTLEQRGWECVWMSDINPRHPIRDRAWIRDAMSLREEHIKDCDEFITNPPWPVPQNQLKGRDSGWPTIPLILHLSALRPTWFLLTSDFAFNRYFTRVHSICTDILSVGRVSWQNNGKKGFDNSAWFRFDQNIEHRHGPLLLPNDIIDQDPYHPKLREFL